MAYELPPLPCEDNAFKKTVTELEDFPTRNIPRWQSNRMRQIIIDRWQETWTVVETRNKRLRCSS